MNVDYSIKQYYTQYDGKHIIMMLKPYKPLVCGDKNYAFVDTYYLAYQELYFYKRNKKQELIDSGYIISELGTPYKKVMADLGIGCFMKNQLVYVEGFGTFFAVEFIVLDKPYENNDVLPLPSTSNDLCKDCNKCLGKCPTKALNGINGFDKQNCIRQLQYAGLGEGNPFGEQIGNSVFGCNICQLACPLNKDFERRGYTEEEREHFELNDFLSNLDKGKDVFAWYEHYVGKNFARKMKFRAFIENAIKNK